ncbi:MAG: cupin domain-containing protein [Oscillospiraceae bacterium]|nr:cupin domain-containing protein [Oscillospiraceae bacterium]
MLLKASDRKFVTVEHLRDGDGYIEKYDCGVVPMPPHATMFAELHLNPNCSIGTHRHEGEYEIFFCKEGEIVLNDNGTERLMHAGDFAVCYDGEEHGIANRTDKLAAVYAAIIKTKED